jgi:hypothetical protein
MHETGTCSPDGLNKKPLNFTAPDPSVELQETYLERYIAPAPANYANHFKSSRT